MARNPGFSVSESGVGGNFFEVPIARVGFTGSVDNSDNVCDPFDPSLGNTYYGLSVSGLAVVWFDLQAYDVRVTLQRGETTDPSPSRTAPDLPGDCPCREHSELPLK